MKIGCNTAIINKEIKHNKNGRPYRIAGESYAGWVIISGKVFHGRDNDSSNGEGIASDIDLPKIHANCHQMITSKQIMLLGFS